MNQKTNLDEADLVDKRSYRDYAYATLFAFSAILLSRVALKVFYPNK